ncbi:MAG TPA: DUF3426 domain-containing protein [Phenylobacterium sp.]
MVEEAGAEPEPEPVVAPPPFMTRMPSSPRRQANGKVLVLAAAAAAIAALVAAAAAFRDQVVQWLPASQAAYAGLGIPVSSLVIENIHIVPAFQGGRPVLAVTGEIRNRRDAIASAPPLRISLLDRAGKPVAAEIAAPIDGQVPARAVRHFAIAIVDPPASVHDLEVTFERSGGRAATQAVPPRAAEAILGAPEPAEARPLPPGSPDALPPHE